MSAEHVLCDFLIDRLLNMGNITATLRECFPGVWGIDQDNLSDYGTWIKVGAPDGQKETHQLPSLEDIEEFPDMVLSNLLAEGSKLLFPTQDRTVDADVVLQSEEKTCTFCIVGRVSSENVQHVCEHILSRLRLLLPESVEG